MHRATFCLLIAALLAVAGAPSAAADERIAVGDRAPAFALQSSTGETYELSSLAGEKKLLMVFFRGTW